MVLPSHHPYFSALSLQVSALYLTGVVPIVAGNKTAKDYLQESAFFQSDITKVSGLRNEKLSSYYIFLFLFCYFYPCKVISV